MALDIDKFVHDQMSVWPEVAASFRALKSVRTRQLPIGGINATVQNNPARLFSCTAEVDEEAMARGTALTKSCPNGGKGVQGFGLVSGGDGD